MPSITLPGFLGGGKLATPALTGLTSEQSRGIELADSVWQEFMSQTDAAAHADKWMRGDNEKPSLPRELTDDEEYRELQESSPTPWLRLAVVGLSQNLYCEGHEPSFAPGDDPAADPPDDQNVWKKLWQPNRMDSRQVAVHRSALAHGVSYVVLERAKISFTREDSIRLRGVSALHAAALWRDDGDDEFPVLFIEAREISTVSGALRGYEVTISDEAHTWRLERSLADERDVQNRGGTLDRDWAYVSHEAHGFPVCPVVRFANDLDLDGRVQGEILPFIPLAKRIDQDTYDRLIVQRFGAWTVRTISGLNIPEDPVKRAALARFLRVNDLLTSSDPNTKFGTMAATPLDGYIHARDSDIRDLAAVTQTPPHYLLGLSPNVSADGLVEAQAGLMRKVDERQHLFGESWELVMRLGAYALGMEKAASDFEAQMKWRDTESRSLAGVADALGKLAQMVGVPVQMLWDRIPGWTAQDTTRATEILEQQSADAELMAMMEGGIDLGGDSGRVDPPTDGLKDAPVGPAPGALLNAEARRRKILQVRNGDGTF